MALWLGSELFQSTFAVSRFVRLFRSRFENLFNVDSYSGSHHLPIRTTECHGDQDSQWASSTARRFLSSRKGFRHEND